jgi:cobalt-zinc-cadmium efflux system membrane fusion protein
MKKYSIFLILCCALAACSNEHKTAANQEKKDNGPQLTVMLTAKQIGMSGIVSAAPTEGESPSLLEANGTVVLLANSKAEISAMFRGQITKILASEGQNIHKGQVLMEMMVPELVQVQQAYVQSSNELDFLRKEKERQQTLVNENAGALKNLQEVDSKYKQQLSIFRAAEAKLRMAGLDQLSVQSLERNGFVDHINITAPIGGYLDHYPVSLGTSVNEGQPLAKINNLEDLHADISVYEKDIQSVHEGQPVNLHFSDAKIPVIEGKVEFIGREVDPLKRSVMLHVSFKAPAGIMILPEMQIKASISTSTVHAFQIPQSAVMKEDEKYYFYYQEKKSGENISFKKQYFQPLNISNGVVSLNTNINAQTLVVVKGTSVLDGELHKDEMQE